ncbi:phenazine biosynthesis FMN-dependent oxidase PhzG [Streptomyces sp. SL13]|uniref:Pyridoxamine 5'-phosphate oxidase n=1 Tax=Streptantibioticus silvisoli TaxID=2705255 RepID=A0AA90H6U4_9ACTN|nr:phenazine biosynthesis FMN-dependent oxidase PhzG [Streptantibioticus silvisoli]MDI5965391.1 phenazine biosynthesis FMN-dependent oxidase PhzG [Streptantibioticus silvisoli]MDI5972023.1 phenazine biosynthesis FMN-dependent oxidase PhzG [Streptantibioticus silvisoli]
MPSPYTLTGDSSLLLPEFDAPPAEPLGLLDRWLDEAGRRGVSEPLAVTLATADSTGRPSARVLLVKQLDARGLVFTSFRGSRKGHDLADRPYAAMTFHWRETLQQIVLAGPVEVLSDEASDRLFAERPYAARATTAVSRQSRPLEDEEDLRERARRLVESGDPVRRPAEWTGYRLVPDNVEFWYGSPDRLHRRLRYDRTRTTADTWTHRRLQP